MRIIDSISDLHGYCPELEGGDLLIIAGDLTANDWLHQYDKFYDWVRTQDYKKIIVIAGNHDNFLQENPSFITIYDGELSYLCDSGTQFEGLKIWGSPWTLAFEGMNPKCKAFTVDTEEELAEKWNLIPNDVDILVTHSPPYGILDKTLFENHVGSVTLENAVQRIKPYLHVFGHVHECGGKVDDLVHYENMCGSKLTTMVNASHVNERYEPVNKPIRMEI